MMKQYLGKNNHGMGVMSFVVSGLAMALMCSCSQKRRTEDIITTKPVAQVKKETQRMGDYEQTRTAEWVGSTYQVEIKREADTTLKLVKDESGNKYYDNAIVLKVIRKDGSEFFNRTFTKADFVDYLDEQTRQNGALLGIVFVKAEGDNLHFAASVGSPDVTSDEYIPLVMKLSRMGNISMARDTQLDMNHTDGEE